MNTVPGVNSRSSVSNDYSTYPAEGNNEDYIQRETRVFQSSLNNDSEENEVDELKRRKYKKISTQRPIYESELHSNTLEATSSSSIARPASLDDNDEAFIQTEIRRLLSMNTVVVPNDNHDENEALKTTESRSTSNISILAIGNKKPLEGFPFQILPDRGVIPVDKNGQFFYPDPEPASFKSKFNDKSESCVPYRVIINIPYYAKNTQSISEVIQVFENTSFGPDRQSSAIKAANSLVFVVGINMMESLDKDLNNTIINKLKEPVNTKCEVHRFGFHWRPRWVNLEKKEVPFEEVRKHYIEIKKKNPRLAAHILKEINQVSTQLVPYREIREVIKQHFFTSNMAKIFRSANPSLPVYLGLFDPDMISAAHVFDTYTNMITSYQESHEGKAPTVLATGYKIPHADTKEHVSPLYALAVELDMAVRHETAKHVKNGIYYPEPNMMVLFESDSMSESFMEGASLKEPKRYHHAYESPTFLADLIKRRNLNPDDDFIFDASNPIMTTMPERMKYELEGKELKLFHGQFNSQQKIVRWRISDLRYLISTAQSHAIPKAWTSRLIRILPAGWGKEPTSIVNGQKKLQICFKDFKGALENALEVLFRQLDPLSILGSMSTTNSQPEIRQFSEILLTYSEKRPPLLAMDGEPEEKLRKMGERLTLTLSPISAKNREGVVKKWKNEEIQAFILYLLGKDTGQKFIQAAFDATGALAKLYNDKLNTQFSELTQNFLESFYEECTQKSGKEYSADLPFTKAQEAILIAQYDPSSPSFTKEALLEKGKFGLNGLHIAALVGDFKLVQYALQYVSASTEADGHILPLHCAILYLINNGVSEINENDLPLVTALASKETCFIKTDMGFTALGLALTRLEHAGSIARECMVGWDVPNYVFEDIESMARLASLKERQTPLLAIMNKREGVYRSRSIFECERHGFSLLEQGSIENEILIGMDDEKEITKLEELVTTPLAESIRQNDLGTFMEIKAAYLIAKAKVPSELVDRDGRPLAICAVVNTTHPNNWLKQLKELGVPLAVVDERDGSPILHEAISPAASRRRSLNFTGDQRRYYEGRDEYLNHSISPKPASIKKMLAIDMLLREPGIDPNEPDIEEDRPLKIALEMGYSLVAWFLIKAGAQIDYLNEEQQNQLSELLMDLYERGDIDNESFMQIMEKRSDFTKVFRNKWNELATEVDASKEDESSFYHPPMEREANYEKLSKWVTKNNPCGSIFKIDDYIELSFGLDLLSYEDAIRFLSSPTSERNIRFINLHGQQMQIYEDIKNFNDNYVGEALKGVKAQFEKEDHREAIPEKKLSKNARKKAQRKALKEQGLTFFQDPAQISLNMLEPASNVVKSRQQENVILSLQAPSAASATVGSSSTKAGVDKKENISPSDFSSISKENIHAEQELQDNGDKDKHSQEAITKQVFDFLRDRLGDKKFSPVDENEIKEYIAALFEAETTKLASSSSQVNISSTNNELPALEFTLCNFIPIEPLTYLMLKIISEQSADAKVQQLTRGDMDSWLRGNTNIKTTDVVTVLIQEIEKLSANQKLFVPINIRDAHFTLLAISKNKENELAGVYLDSYGDYEGTWTVIKNLLDKGLIKIKLTALTKNYQHNNNCAIQVYEAFKILLHANEKEFNSEWLEKQIKTLKLDQEEVETSKRASFANKVRENMGLFSIIYSRVDIDKKLTTKAEVDKKENISPSDFSSISKGNTHAEQELHDNGDKDKHSQEKITKQVFDLLRERLGDKKFFQLEENEIKKYIAALCEIETTKLAASPSQGNGASTNSELPVLKFTLCNFIPINPLIWLMQKIISEQGADAKVQHLTRKDMNIWLRRNSNIKESYLFAVILQEIENLSANQKLFVPINIDNEHFTLLAISKNKENELAGVYLDSYGDYNGTWTVIKELFEKCEIKIKLTALTEKYQHNNNCAIHVYEVFKILLRANETQFNNEWLKQQIKVLKLDQEEVETSKRASFANEVYENTDVSSIGYSDVDIDEMLANKRAEHDLAGKPQKVSLIKKLAETSLQDEQKAPDQNSELTKDFSKLKLNSNQESLQDGQKRVDETSETINGFSKLASENWMEDKIQELCKKYNAAFGAILNEDVLQLITIGAEEIPTDQPTVFLINNKMHYSIFIKNKEGVFRYNSLKLELNELEKVFLEEKIHMKLTATNKLTPQTDGWSCGFHALYALELFLQNNSLDLIDKKPLSVTQLNEMLSTYVKDLDVAQEEIWSDYKTFYKTFIDDKSVGELSHYLKSICASLRSKDLEIKCPTITMQEKKKFLEERMNIVKQIECLLVGLWKLEKAQTGAFSNFMKLVALDIGQRKSLYKLLIKRSWTREALVNKFLETYLQVKGERLMPDKLNFD